MPLLRRAWRVPASYHPARTGGSTMALLLWAISLVDIFWWLWH